MNLRSTKITLITPAIISRVIKLCAKGVVCFFCCITYSLTSQNPDHVFELAIKSACKNDTSRYIQIIQNYINKKGSKGRLASAYFLQSLAHEKIGDNNKAIFALEQALTNYQGFENLVTLNDPCEWIPFDDNYRYLSEYGLLIKMSELYQKEQKFDIALKFLDKINRKNIFGYNGCANGMRMFETRIAMAKANCYLGLSDTISAIKLLVDYCLFEEGNDSEASISLLKPLLYTQFSKDQIEAEINESIRNVKVNMINHTSYDKVYTFEQVEYTLWGRKIPLLFMTLKEFQYFVSVNKNLAYLRN